MPGGNGLTVFVLSTVLPRTTAIVFGLNCPPCLSEGQWVPNIPAPHRNPVRTPAHKNYIKKLTLIFKSFQRSLFYARKFSPPILCVFSLSFLTNFRDFQLAWIKKINIRQHIKVQFRPLGAALSQNNEPKYCFYINLRPNATLFLDFSSWKPVSSSALDRMSS